MMRMSHQDFNYILSVIEQDITLHHILGGNKVINSKARLALAIRFFAMGESFRSLEFQVRISTLAISYIVYQVCCAIVKNMGDFLKCPSSPEEWLDIAKHFEDRWHYPNSIGAIDGKTYCYSASCKCWFPFLHLQTCRLCCTLSCSWPLLHLHLC